MENIITLHDLSFEPYISENQIKDAVKELANKINSEFGGEELHIVSALTGSFIFTADLVRELEMPCQIHFVKVSSYHGGTSSTGTIRLESDIQVDFSNKNVLITEDIVDTGLTASFLFELIKNKGAKNIKLATLLYKPEAYKEALNIDFIGFSIPNEFVVGYGLDYKEIGRNIKEIYKLKQS